MIIKKVVVGELMTNCYLLACKETKKTAIIDPGADKDIIIDKLKELDLNPQYIILTHAHADHIGAVKELKKYYNIPICVHKNDEKMLNDSNKNLTALIFGKDIVLDADRVLEDKENIRIGSLTIEIIHTPGHTLGGISLKCNNVIFSGDTLFNEGIGRTDLPGGSHQQIIDSIKSRIFSYDNGIIVYPGHGMETSIGYEKENNPFID